VKARAAPSGFPGRVQGGPDGRLAEGALVVNTIIWGATFVVVKSALAHVSPILFLVLRFGLATLALAAVFGRAFYRNFTRQSAAAGALAGLFLGAGYVLQTEGLRFTTAPKSAFLTGLTSVMVPLLGSLVYRIRPQVSEVAGVVTATAGLALMSLPGLSGTISRGDLLTVLGAIAFAAHIVTLGHFSEQMRFEILSISQVGAAAVLALTLLPWMEPSHVEWHPAVVYAILITGFLATALTFTVQAWAMHYTTSTRTALIYMLEPVFAWITSFWLVGEGLAARAGAGAALILGGVLLVELKPWNSRVHPSQ
jgi:drug/metabolite transporter (DMT)-like permease